MDTVYQQLEAVDLVASASNMFGGGPSWGPDSVVLSIDPDAGTEVLRGTTVKIVEGDREDIVFYSQPMPDLTGNSWIESEGMPASVFIYAEIEWVARGPGDEPGIIVGQDPTPGSKLELGQRVRLTVTDYAEKPDNSSGDSGGGDIDFDIDLPSLCAHTRWC